MARREPRRRRRRAPDRRLGRFWTDREPAGRYEPFNLLHRNQMMENEPPVHTRLRSLVAKAALSALLDHAPAIELAAEPVQRPTFVLRAYNAVRIRVTAGPAPSL